jgi:hypothetical protein
MENIHLRSYKKIASPVEGMCCFPLSSVFTLRRDYETCAGTAECPKMASITRAVVSFNKQPYLGAGIARSV